MKNRLQTINLAMGISVVILFAITGQLMKHYYVNYAAPDVERLYRRSRHMYILMAGLAHGGIGIYIVALQNKIANQLQWLATVLMVMASLCFIYSFFYEIPADIIRTPVSTIGAVLLLTGVLLHFICSLFNSYLNKKNH